MWARFRGALFFFVWEARRTYYRVKFVVVASLSVNMSYEPAPQG